MRLRLLALLVLPLTACPAKKEPPASGAALASQARASLAERERKVQSYRLEGVTTDAASGQKAAFRFAFRSPGKMRGELDAPSPRVFAFDGKSLAELDVAAGKLVRYDLAALPRAKADAVLHQIFSPFAPEGYRAPLLPAGNVLQATAEPGPDGKPGVVLAAELAEGADRYAFRFRFRTPAMDLLEKEVRAPGGGSKLRVTAEQCDAPTGLCFPRELVEERSGKELTRTAFSRIEINAPVPDEAFALSAPDGGTEERRSFAEER